MEVHFWYYHSFSLHREEAWNKRTINPVVKKCTNMSIVSAGIYVVSMFISGIFIERWNPMVHCGIIIG